MQVMMDLVLSFKHILPSCLTLFGITTSLVIFPNLGLADVGLSAKGRIPRNLDDGKFEIDITVRDIEQNDINLRAEEQSFFERIKLFVKELKDNEHIPRETNDNTLATSQLGFVTGERSAKDQQLNASNKYDVTLHAVVKATKAGALKELMKDKSKLTLKITYVGGEAENQKEELESTEIKLDTGVANEAPQSITSESGHKRVTITWTAKPAIEILGGTDKQAAPSGVTVFAIDTTLGIVSLPAKKYNSDLAQETDAECTVSPVPNDNTACVSCPAEPHYINLTELERRTPEGVFFQTTSQDSMNLSGLEFGKEYTIFATYLPDGVIMSTCYKGVPTINFTLTELSGENDAEQAEPCFIATATYGSPMHKDVKTFRWFRDQILKQYMLGRWFIKIYYKLSPPLANLIADHPHLRALSRVLLSVPLKAIYMIRKSLGRVEKEPDARRNDANDRSERPGTLYSFQTTRALHSSSPGG